MLKALCRKGPVRLPVRTGYIDLHKPRLMQPDDFHRDYRTGIHRNKVTVFIFFGKHYSCNDLLNNQTAKRLYLVSRIISENDAKSKNALKQWSITRSDTDRKQKEEVEKLFTASFSKVKGGVKASSLGLGEQLLKNGKIKLVTETQKQVIEAVMNGQNVFLSGKKGDGKSLSFILPIVQKVLKQKSESGSIFDNSPQAVIVVPSEESGRQILQEIIKIAYLTNLKPVLDFENSSEGN